MGKVLLIVVLVAAVVISGCITDRQAGVAGELTDEEIVVLLREPNTVQWEYPIMPKVWYPGEEFHADECFTYYTTRCWPGCHDPNTQPRPYKY